MEKRDVLLLLLALAVSALGIGAVWQGGALETGSWGLSFPQPGQAPTGPASREELARYDAVYLGDPSEKTLYLTFDAGYENGFTAQILDILDKHQVKAVFFLVGNYLEQNPELVRRMVERGHTVGNHTLHHYDMSKIGDLESFSRELQGLEQLYREVTGEELPKVYRPPQGIYSRENLEMAQKLGYRTVFWSLAYADWDNSAQPTREYALEKLQSRVHNGAVILLHTTSQTNALILDELLTQWKAQGYSFGRIQDLFP